MPSAVMDQWVSRVLGVTIAGSDGAASAGQPETSGAPKDWAEALTEWREANATIDGQIEALRKRLLQTDDEDLEDIAEYGLNALTGNNRVRTMAALQDLAAGTPEVLRKGAPNALPVIEAFSAHLASSEEVAACDDNPFGVMMSIRQTLGGALDNLANALKAQV